MNFTNLQNCAPKDWAQISTLIERWPFKQLAEQPGTDLPDLFAVTAGRVIRTLESDKGAAWMVHHGQSQGFISLSMLPWDSQQLGFAAGRIDYLVAEGAYPQQHETKRALLRHAINEATRRGLSHLSVRVDSNALSSLHVLEEAGFITVDNILTFALDLNSYQRDWIAHNFVIREASEEDADRTADLARSVYSKDRFHSDPLINRERADQLHAEWVRNSCLGSAADVVFLAESDQQLHGFITCKVQREALNQSGQTSGTIVLIGCAENVQGSGVGYGLTMSALDWFQGQGCTVVEVGTQLRNLPAARLYQKCGFRLAGSSTSLRLVL